ncbi:MAG: hypothetical protein ACRC0R_02630 [Cetobacterium sp.]
MYVLTDNALLLTVGDRVVVSVEDYILVGTVNNITKKYITLELDIDGSRIKVVPDSGSILAELKPSRKRFKSDYTIKSWKRELVDYISDLGGSFLDKVKVPKIKQPILEGDTIFVWSNKQAVPKRVIALRVWNGKQAVVFEHNNIISILDRSLFSNIIGVAKRLKNIPEKISLKDLLPYLESYNSDLVRKIDNEFENPILNEFTDNILSVVRKTFSKVKISKIDLSVGYEDSELIRIIINPKYSVEDVKAGLHSLWGIFGNVLKLTSDYDDMYFDVELKDDNVSKSYLEKIIEENL